MVVKISSHMERQVGHAGWRAAVGEFGGRIPECDPADDRWGTDQGAGKCSQTCRGHPTHTRRAGSWLSQSQYFRWTHSPPKSPQA